MTNDSDPCIDCALCCKKLIIEIEHVDIEREPKLAEVAEPMKGDPFVPCDSEGIAVNPWDRQYMLACGKECPMLEGDRCSIHPTRPIHCVAFQVGGEHCARLREAYGLPAIPPPAFAWEAED